MSNRTDRYNDERYCDNCERVTEHGCQDSMHERDSSWDLAECLTCGWIFDGFSGKYAPPNIENATPIVEDVIKAEDITMTAIIGIFPDGLRLEPEMTQVDLKALEDAVFDTVSAIFKRQLDFFADKGGHEYTINMKHGRIGYMETFLQNLKNEVGSFVCSTIRHYKNER